MPELGLTRLDHVGLSVADLDAIAAWYCAAFELTEQHRFTYDIGRREVRGALLSSAEGWRLELQQCEESVAGQPPDVLRALLRQGQGHLCLRVEDIGGAFDLLVERGALPVFPPTDSPLPGMRVAYVTDPEGNFVELLEERDV